MKQNRITHYILNALTFLFVAVNLIPIAWMVWCGFKDNNEILLGTVMPGWRDNSAILTGILDNGDYLLCGRDGSVSVFAAKDLHVVRHRNFGTFATNAFRDHDTLWLMSANKGLLAINCTNLGIQSRRTISDMKRDYPGTWKKIWVNDVSRSTVFKSGEKIVAALFHKDFPGFAVVDAATGRCTFTGNEYRRTTGTLTAASPYDPESIVLAGERGLFLYHYPNSSVIKSWYAPSALPAVPITDIQSADGALFLLSPARVLCFSPAADSVLYSIDHTRELGPSTLTAMALSDGMVWLGNSRMAAGFLRGDSLNRAPGELALSMVPDFGIRSGSTMQRGSANKNDMVSAEIHAIAGDNSTMIIGGPRGSLAVSSVQKPTDIRYGLAPKSGRYIHWRNYIDMWRNIKFGLYLQNSLIICLSVMLISILFASMAGYALARYSFTGKNVVGYSILATQMVPGLLLLIPIYLMFVSFANITGIVLKDTYFGVILMYVGYFTPASIWIMRGFFAAIPKDLEEAALMDGCTPLEAFFKVILPVALPGLVATGVFTFLLAWDELMFAWVLTGEKTATLPVGIRLFIGNFQNRYDLTMAAATVATVPVMALFFIMQKQIVSGLTAGAVKE